MPFFAVVATSAAIAVGIPVEFAVDKKLIDKKGDILSIEKWNLAKLTMPQLFAISVSETKPIKTCTPSHQLNATATCFFPVAVY